MTTTTYVPQMTSDGGPPRAMALSISSMHRNVPQNERGYGAGYVCFSFEAMMDLPMFET